QPPPHLGTRVLEHGPQALPVVAILSGEDDDGLSLCTDPGASPSRHRSPPKAPENHSSPSGRPSLLSMISWTLSCETAGMTDAPSSRRSQTTSSSGLRRSASAGE